MPLSKKFKDVRNVIETHIYITEKNRFMEISSF